MNKNPLHPITQEDRETYERDGVVCLRGMFDQEWIDKMRAAVDDASAHPDRYEIFGPSHSDEFLSIIYLWRSDGPFRDFVLNSPAGEIVGQVMGCSEIKAFQDHLFIKPKGSPHIMNWHHDATTWPMNGHQVPTLWMALSNVTESNGRLEFVAGYHKQLVEQNVVYRANYKRGDFGPVDSVICPDFTELRKDPDFSYKIAGFDLAPGDVVIFHPRTPHGSSHALNAKEPRIGLSSRWIGDDITWHFVEGNVGVPGLDEMPEGERPQGDLFPVVWRDPEGSDTRAA